MPLTLRQIRKNCELARAAFARTRSEHFALGAFNLDNQETLLAVAKAAHAKKAPVLVEVSQNEVEAIGLDNVRDLVENYKAQFGLEMYINLDHSPTVEAAIDGIEAGYECIHIDISQAKHEAARDEIIAGTKEVVEAAKLTGALVEAEERYFLGSSNLHTETIDYEQVKKTMTKPEEAADFVKQTGIDTFAAQVGNLHGLYPVPKILNLELLAKIREAIDCNISLHGGSGTPPHYFEQAVKIGVSKVNINSDIRVAYRRTLERELAENKTEYAVVKLMGDVIAEVQKVVESKIDIFSSAGKAQPDT
ncbi:ketose-bisphosphate aldolase [Candidatus Saccharibacteria bacterium RIFCSPHIGHO2_12_FULL_49_19]|nr:MAG: ketose-bisphosphate aldolase [Candidatus Saccharibacteria bacterium RIFCSPHIGHO2_12_FULL_49_19]OGL38126.1 MAG: ketose-bisphosphate aldolase [Candidatus Saccharibacteria bacterium RIFCSPLOWO2_01_FULL_49_22]